MGERIKIKRPEEVANDELSVEATRILVLIAKKVRESNGKKFNFEVNDVYRDEFNKNDVRLMKNELEKSGWKLNLTFSHTSGVGPMEHGERNYIKVKITPIKS